MAGKLLLPGEIIAIKTVDEDDRKTIVEHKYKVLGIYPHHVLCQKIKGKYRESFDRYQLYKGGVIDLESMTNPMLGVFRRRSHGADT